MAQFKFVQLADPQIGMRDFLGRMGAESPDRLRESVRPFVPHPDEDGIAREVRHLEFALAEAARRDVSFVVVCGDMVHNIDRPEQLDALRAARRTLPDDIPIYWVPGNHDVAVDASAGPTPDGLAWYGETFGEDYYAFRVEDAYFLALNSELLADSSQAPDEGARHMRFIEDALASEEARTAAQRVVFMHRPLFVGSIDSDHQMAVPSPQRERLLHLFKEHDVRTVMAGHMHRESHSRDAGLEIAVTTGLGFAVDGQSGFRTVMVEDERLSHEFHKVADEPASAS